MPIINGGCTSPAESETLRRQVGIAPWLKELLARCDEARRLRLWQPASGELVQLPDNGLVGNQNGFLSLQLPDASASARRDALWPAGWRRG
jgi:hypothetical protein